ncbi:amino acid permease [Trifolium pratense]|uniref:Amino acid permease n=1 Tax=Trifolium pratense TaxID=57577 RepID=A0A2K3JYI3_TRIPR|nr:amino acid permease [Trifolium pratense]
MGLESCDSADNINNPLLLNQIQSHPIKRTGTVWTAVAHIVTGVIGSGVLSLPWSIAQLGWIVGPFSILLIASSTLYSAFLLCNTYRSPNPEYGPHRSASYLDVVNFNLDIHNLIGLG